MNEEKKSLREIMRRRLQGITFEERAAESGKIASALARSDGWAASACIGLFAGRTDEIDTAPFWPWTAGKTIAFPRVNGGEMDFFAVKHTSYLLPPELNRWGIAEPLGGEKVTPELIVVPGLAFSRCGGRLGRGGGYYDRWLAAHPQVIKVGVAFSFQIVPQVPLDDHDIRMNFIATETGLELIK